MDNEDASNNNDQPTNNQVSIIHEGFKYSNDHFESFKNAETILQ